MSSTTRQAEGGIVSEWILGILFLLAVLLAGAIVRVPF